MGKNGTYNIWGCCIEFTRTTTTYSGSPQHLVKRNSYVSKQAGNNYPHNSKRRVYHEQPQPENRRRRRIFPGLQIPWQASGMGTNHPSCQELCPEPKRSKETIVSKSNRDEAPENQKTDPAWCQGGVSPCTRWRRLEAEKITIE